MSITTEPTTVVQGEQVEWTRDFCDYPATEWTLEYRFRGPGTGFNIASTADGDDFVTVLTSTLSAAAAVGSWTWQAWATNIEDTDIVLMLDQGNLKIFQGFASGDTDEIDLRSPAKKTLDALDAALMESGDILKYEISTPAGSRRVERASRDTVMQMRKYWAGIVARESFNGAKTVVARMYEC